MNLLDKFVIEQRLNHIKENPCWLYSDIDGTLIIHDEKIEIPDPARIKLRLMGKDYYFLPHEKNINTLIQMHKRGFICVAWSAAGKKWAAQAVKALKLEKYFTYVLAKPMYFLDDLDPEKWLGKNLFRPFEE